MPSYGRASAQLASNLQADESDAIDGGISMRAEALVLICLSVQIRR